MAESIAGGKAAEQGVTAQNLKVDFANGKMSITADRLAYGIVQLQNLNMTGRLTAQDGVLDAGGGIHVASAGLAANLVPKVAEPGAGAVRRKMVCGRGQDAGRAGGVARAVARSQGQAFPGDACATNVTPHPNGVPSRAMLEGTPRPCVLKTRRRRSATAARRSPASIAVRLGPSPAGRRDSSRPASGRGGCRDTSSSTSWIKPVCDAIVLRAAARTGRGGR